jgi:uncharacterized protein YndB with AHSA1/START domain
VKPLLVMTREYALPRQHVFAAWLQPERLARWWSAREVESRLARSVREGDAFRVPVIAADGTACVLRVCYEAIESPERIVFTWGVAELADTLVTVSFSERDGKTQLELRQVLIDARVAA